MAGLVQDANNLICSTIYDSDEVYYNKQTLYLDRTHSYIPRDLDILIFRHYVKQVRCNFIYLFVFFVLDLI